MMIRYEWPLYSCYKQYLKVIIIKAFQLQLLLISNVKTNLPPRLNWVWFQMFKDQKTLSIWSLSRFSKLWLYKRREFLTQIQWKQYNTHRSEFDRYLIKDRHQKCRWVKQHVQVFDWLAWYNSSLDI